MSETRLEHEPPEASEKWGWKYHHLGIPTTEKMPEEKYLPQFKFYHSGFPASPFGIEWMRFAKDSPIHPLIQKADLRTSYNFSINPEQNQINGAKFSLETLPGLLHKYDIEIG